ncbi:hypothetical protein PMIN06_013142 [Paraphaeosphaeria minitans]
MQRGGKLNEMSKEAMRYLCQRRSQQHLRPPRPRTRQNLRMQAAGVPLVCFLAMLSDLMREWRIPFPGVDKIVLVVNEYMSAYGYLMRGACECYLAERNGAS